MKRKTFKLISILFIFIMLFTACSQTGNETISEGNGEPQVDLSSYNIKIIGLDSGEQTITAEEVVNMETITLNTTNISSSGEVVEGEVKGTKIDNILSQYGVSQKDYDGIRFFAGDGYSIIVPKEILEAEDVLIHWEFDGKPLNEKHQPLRIAVPDERSMYWIGQLAGMELIKESAEEAEGGKIVFLYAACNALEPEDYTYYENVDQAVKTADMLETFNLPSESEDVFIEAVDDYSKTEKKDIFLTGYIKFTGEDTPLFLSPELPKGMHVKNILWIQNGSTRYISESQAFTKYADELINVLDDECVPLSKIEELTGLPEGETYLFTAADGYTKELDRETFLKGAIYSRNNGGYGISFEGMDKKAKVKDILSIEIVN